MKAESTYLSRFYPSVEQTKAANEQRARLRAEQEKKVEAAFAAMEPKNTQHVLTPEGIARQDALLSEYERIRSFNPFVATRFLNTYSNSILAAIQRRSSEK
jgi:hypothetical protein